MWIMYLDQSGNTYMYMGLRGVMITLGTMYTIYVIDILGFSVARPIPMLLL